MAEGELGEEWGATNGEERVTKSGARGKREGTAERKWEGKKKGGYKDGGRQKKKKKKTEARSQRARRGGGDAEVCPSRHYSPHRFLFLYRPVTVTGPVIGRGPVSLSPSLSFLFLFLCLARPPWLRSSAGALGPRNS